MKSDKIVNGLSIVLSLLIVVGVFTFAHVCGEMGGETPSCHATRSFAVVLAGAVAVLSVFLFFYINRGLTYVLSIARTVLGFLLVLLPDVLAPVCKMHTMHCYVYTRPLLMITGSFLTALALYGLTAVIWKEQEAKRGQGHEALS